MVFYTYKLLILLVCIGFFVFVLQPEKVSAMTSKDHLLRWEKEEHGLVFKNQRVLKAVDVVSQDLKTKKKSAPTPPKFDPNQSSKRRVRRGSDPIHNRC
ncbi:hypothetical protein BVC80_9097g67 [Macleaya cordata]|uniref:CLAVATA3/ESR (CLE)-related protein 45 n=1 Tax=Macleaya cordata TaxID=56857 RepID=A0A200QEY4_MACCD|nr:hypothetical protein BVC80_9097g67 [Macleaya cordata]